MTKTDLETLASLVGRLMTDLNADDLRAARDAFEAAGRACEAAYDGASDRLRGNIDLALENEERANSYLADLLAAAERAS